MTTPTTEAKMRLIFKNNLGFLFFFVIGLMICGCSARIADSQNLQSEPIQSATFTQQFPSKTEVSNQTTLKPRTTETLQPTITSTPKPNLGLIWKAGFENGNMDEFDEIGGFVRQGASSSYNLVTPHAHSGNYSIGLTIDTLAPSNTGSHAAYLFFWNQLAGNAYYYSAWYYIPSNVEPKDWWNIMQWKSTNDGNSDNSVPIYVLDIRNDRGFPELVLVHLPEQRDKTKFYQDIMEVPTDTWFHVEAYYKKATDSTGKIIIWQDETQIFEVNNTSTVLSDNTIYWSVNNYSNSIEPNPLTIFVDDIAISETKLGDNPLP